MKPARKLLAGSAWQVSTAVLLDSNQRGSNCAADTMAAAFDFPDRTLLDEIAQAGDRAIRVIRAKDGAVATGSD